MKHNKLITATDFKYCTQLKYCDFRVKKRLFVPYY